MNYNGEYVPPENNVVKLQFGFAKLEVDLHNYNVVCKSWTHKN